VTTLDISLPDDMMAFVESQAAHEGYASVSDYLRALIREDQDRQAKRELEAKLLEGLQGPETEMTPEDPAALRAEAIEDPRGEDIRP
jgi:antitoxin ParD1/3/4